VKRSDALARLEGRSGNRSGHAVAAHTRSRTRVSVVPQKDFINLSDDEDSEDGDISDDSEDSFIEMSPPRRDTLLLPESILIEDEMDWLALGTEAPRAAPSPPTTTRNSRTRSHVHSQSTPILPSPPRPRRQQRQRSTDWFPLQSFIDLKSEREKEDEVSQWNWRSFIEVALT
jgi:hypothetical protein